MILAEEIKLFAASIPADINENRGIYEIAFTVAERKSFLTRQKLEYRAKFRIDDANRVLKFIEMLKESGAGLSSGETTPGFGFKTETYNTFNKAREGTIEEQSNLFGKKYEYKFDFKTIRPRIEETAAKAGYQFKYQITSIGL
jgi:hypothetical protein